MEVSCSATLCKSDKRVGHRRAGKSCKKAGKLYFKYKNEIERECTDDEFMAMFEQYPEFDDLDDLFVENEETWTGMVACYVDEHIERFVTVEE